MNNIMNAANSAGEDFRKIYFNNIKLYYREEA
jgi:hypothetical protein